MTDNRFDTNDIIGEFDPEYRIVHITAKYRIVFSTVEDGIRLSHRTQEILAGYLAPGRGYMVTDYTKIVIDPGLIKLYGKEMRDIIDSYLYPGGLARYGMEITRVTAKLGHANYLGGKPNLFSTREEAFAFIREMSREQREAERVSGVADGKNS